MLHPVIVILVGLVVQVLGLSFGLRLGIGAYVAVVAGATTLWVALALVWAMAPVDTTPRSRTSARPQGGPPASHHSAALRMPEAAPHQPTSGAGATARYLRQ